MRSIALVISVALSAASCAHYPDVRPGDSEVHTVIIMTERKDEGFKESFAQAKDFCDDVFKQRPVRVKETSEYVGTMDESTYNAAKTASKVAQGVGVAAAVLGGKNESKAGVGVGVGGGIADGAIGKDYKYTMTFKCK
jgi:hypothetical protein